MVKLICDKCGSDCDRIGYDILIRMLRNFAPYDKNDKSSPCLTDGDQHLRILLCQDCYMSLRLPNLYIQEGKKEVVWEKSTEGDSA